MSVPAGTSAPVSGGRRTPKLTLAAVFFEHALYWSLLLVMWTSSPTGTGG